MKDIVTGQHAANSTEFAELALGIDTELFTGIPGESATERAARLDAARDIIADLTLTDPELATYAQRLLDAAPTPLRRRAARPRRAPMGVAA